MEVCASALIHCLGSSDGGDRMRGENTITRLSLAAALDVRDAFVKSIYGRKIVCRSKNRLLLQELYGGGSQK